MTTGDLAARHGESLMNTFGPPKLVLTRGEGPYVWDADGRKHLDLLSGNTFTKKRPSPRLALCCIPNRGNSVSPPS